MGKAAIVVGGTRRVGRWASQALLSEGYAVHAVYRADDSAAQQCERELARAGYRLHLHRADATDFGALSDVVAGIAASGGSLEVLVNSAGPSLQKPILLTDADEFETLWRHNVLVVHNAVVAAMPHFGSNGGRIINFVSVGADRARAKQHVPAYAACKAMLENYSRSLAREVAAEGVTVNCIALGMTTLPLEGAPAVAREKLPLGRAVSAEDLAAVIRYLTSPAADQVTGAVINLSGGWGL